MEMISLIVRNIIIIKHNIHLRLFNYHLFSRQARIGWSVCDRDRRRGQSFQHHQSASGRRWSVRVYCFQSSRSSIAFGEVTSLRYVMLITIFMWTFHGHHQNMTQYSITHSMKTKNHVNILDYTLYLKLGQIPSYYTFSVISQRDAHNNILNN